MARYYSGLVTLPADGSAVPVCRAGEAGVLVHNEPAGSAAVYLGGPDVTPATGLELDPGTTDLVPGALALRAPVVPAPADDPVLVLYACTDPGKAATLSWLSVLPPPPPGGP
jgi:hypothetical protein